MQVYNCVPVFCDLDFKIQYKLNIGIASLPGKNMSRVFIIKLFVWTCEFWFCSVRVILIIASCKHTLKMPFDTLESYVILKTEMYQSASGFCNTKS